MMKRTYKVRFPEAVVQDHKSVDGHVQYLQILAPNEGGSFG